MAHHEPFKALGPIDWGTVSSHEDAGSLPSALAAIFADAQTLADSVPAASSNSSNRTPGRPRSATDSAAVGPANPGGAAAAALRAEWKDVKVGGGGGGAGDNPQHAMAVYRLAGRDGRGAWFARRSVHRAAAAGGVGFDHWRAGLRGEFDETLRRTATAKGPEPGEGNIRGIGAERKVEARDLGADGSLRVYQCAAKFPGPTTPRDFVTLLLTSSDSQDDNDKRRRRPRQFMVVSKPCIHPDCPQRQGFIRGQYESVELIREVPVDRPLRRVRSSIDVSRHPSRSNGPGGGSGGLGKNTIARSERQTATGTGRSGDQARMISFAETPAKPSKSDVCSEDEEDVEMAIEWLMVTRSDPGGSVPRFLVEKGTPPGIVSDAGRLLDWLSKENPNTKQDEVSDEVEADSDGGSPLPESSKETTTINSGRTVLADEPSSGGSGGLYGMITSALGAAGSVATNKLLYPSSSTQTLEEEDEDGTDDEDDTSTIASFASAEEGEPVPAALEDLRAGMASSSLSARSAASGESSNPPSMSVAQRYDKALRKLDEWRRRAEEKTARAQDRDAQAVAKLREKHDKELAKRRKGEERDAQAVTRLQEKHERELARQEEKYRRERDKLDEKRRKIAEGAERTDLKMGLEKAKTERDVALGQIEILRDQVGALQAQNTLLVARLGEMGGMAGMEATWGSQPKESGQWKTIRSQQS